MEKLGLLETATFVGVFVGCLLTPLLLRKLGANSTVVLASFMCAAFISPFGYTKGLGFEGQYWFLFGTRIVTGTFLVSIYLHIISVIRGPNINV